MNLLELFVFIQNFSTSPINVCGLGTNEEVDAFTFIVQEDIFAKADNINPVYVKIHFENPASLSETLVAPSLGLPPITLVPEA